MAAVSDYLDCPECGKQHAFCDPDADTFLTGAMYEYVCPSTKATALISAPEEWNEVSQRCPIGSVKVKRIGLQHP